MILTWVISLLLLCSSLIFYLERLAVLNTIEIQTIEKMQERFMASETSILECERSINHLSVFENNTCRIQKLEKNRWRISSKEKPIIQVEVLLDEKTATLTRLNWRQIVE